MAHDREYKCTICGAAPGLSETESRDLLTVKKVSFLEMGLGGRTLRSRVVGWLCPRCVKADPDYQREPFAVPGDTPAQRVVSG